MSYGHLKLKDLKRAIDFQNNQAYKRKRFSKNSIITITMSSPILKTYFILLTFSLVFLNSTSAQQVIFEYDDSGNRILRQVIELRVAPPQDSSNMNSTNMEEQSVFDEINPVNSTLADGREVYIYPNPTDGEVLIEISEIREDETGELLILSMEGKIIEQKTELDKSIPIDLSAQASGNYILKLRLGKQNKEWVIVKEGTNP